MIIILIILSYLLGCWVAYTLIDLLRIKKGKRDYLVLRPKTTKKLRSFQFKEYKRWNDFPYYRNWDLTEKIAFACWSWFGAWRLLYIYIREALEGYWFHISCVISHKKYEINERYRKRKEKQKQF